jgi:hypothetical protein
MNFLLAILLAMGNPKPEQPTLPLAEQAIYFAAAKSLFAISQIAQCAGAVCSFFRSGHRAANECLLFGKLCGAASRRLLTRWFQERNPLLFRTSPASHTSWLSYKDALSRIPAESGEERELLHFLERRWLAKGNGFISATADWACPLFGISVQTHPATSSTYARDPGSHLSITYKNRVDGFKALLPHPREFPLILTRPEDVSSYLPSCIPVAKGENAEAAVSQAVARQAEKVVLDLTEVLPLDSADWNDAWDSYRSGLAAACEAVSLDPESLFCIQRVKRDGIGALRILPLSLAQSDEAHRYLLDWVSHFGLTANMVELDRWLLSAYDSLSKVSFPTDDAKIEFPDLGGHFMIDAAVKLLKGFFSSIDKERWTAVNASSTRSALVHLALSQIQEQFLLLKRDQTLFETLSRLEEIHTHLSSLLEIFSPFDPRGFAAVYRSIAPVPPALQPLTSYGLHMSGMTSLAGVFRALEKSLGRKPRVVYGKNSYFECVHAAHWISDALSENEASEEDFRNADLLIAQFHPVLQRAPNIFEYSEENIGAALRKALSAERQRPLTLALDDTIDFIRSPRVHDLLSEFRQEIEKGDLNVVCLRSPKFDLFGMDNYSGAPFFMVHSTDPKWSAFDLLLSDPALQTDRLSANWFCLAYRFAAEEEDLYRKAIFDNTRALLEQTPPRLFEKSQPCRIVPFKEEAIPSFIDIRISGPFHKWRAALVGWRLFSSSMEEKIPIFTRLSIGFYHPNFTVIFGEEDTTLRLTLGIDPKEASLFADCFKQIAELNQVHH